MAAALKEYELHKYATSGHRPRSSVEATWREYHAKAHRLEPHIVVAECFPITVDALARVAALMKLDQYRSFSNYAYWAKAEHTRLGYAWSPQLALELKAGLRSLGRGIGPARQSQTFDLLLIAACLAKEPDQDDGQPLFPGYAVVLGSLWVLREIELAWAVWSDITVDDCDRKVTWRLPVSKTDPQAKACSRSWGCLCAHLAQEVCPYHVFVDYRHRVREQLDLQGSSPVFPDRKGLVVQKAAMVLGFEKVFMRAGLACRDAAGRRCFGGHSCRVAGSRFWAASGLELMKLQIFARWGSNVILRYVAEAPLACLTLHGPRSPVPTTLRPLPPTKANLEPDKRARFAEGFPAAQARSEVVSSSSSLRPAAAQAADDTVARIAALDLALKQAVVDTAALRAEVHRLRADVMPQYALNPASRVWHKVLIESAALQRSDWKTCCGWKFGECPHSLSNTGPLPDDRACEKCLPNLSPNSASSDEDDGNSVSAESS
jgi:hypothetical protein